ELRTLSLHDALPIWPPGASADGATSVSPSATTVPDAAAGPFDPAGVTWDRLSPRLITARLVVLALMLGVPIIACAIVAVLVTPWVWIPAGVLPALLLWAARKSTRLNSSHGKISEAGCWLERRRVGG